MEGKRWISEYVQVACRNTIETCLKSVSKTPTSRFFRDFQLFQNPAKLAKFRPNLGQFWPKWAIFQISLKNQSRHYFLIPETRRSAKIRKFQCEVFGKKCETLIFEHFGSNRPILDHFWSLNGLDEPLDSLPFVHNVPIFLKIAR